MITEKDVQVQFLTGQTATDVFGWEFANIGPVFAVDIYSVWILSALLANIGFQTRSRADIVKAIQRISQKFLMSDSEF